MNVRRLLCTTAAIACVAATAPALGDHVPIKWFADDEFGGGFSGSVSHWDWNNGGASTFGEVMNSAANKAGIFGGAAFKKNKISIFIVDFTNASGELADAGITVFVMWGNGTDPDGDFQASVDVSRRVDEGDDGDFTPGVSEIFALGDGVEFSHRTLTVDVDVNNNETPVGFAISNFMDFPNRRINQQFTTSGSIRRFRLVDPDGIEYTAIDDDRNDDVFTDGIVLQIIPAPPAAAWGLAGLAGLALVSRRRFTRKNA
jgi:hypothetical protein